MAEHLEAGAGAALVDLHPPAHDLERADIGEAPVPERPDGELELVDVRDVGAYPPAVPQMGDQVVEGVLRVRHVGDEGVGVVDWMVPGGRDIAVATSKLMEQYNVAIWAHHGMFCSGADFDETFGLMHTVEKSAEILVKVLSMTDRKRQTITPDEFRALAKDFHVTLPEKFLFEKSEHYYKDYSLD